MYRAISKFVGSFDVLSNKNTINEILLSIFYLIFIYLCIYYKHYMYTQCAYIQYV